MAWLPAHDPAPRIRVAVVLVVGVVVGAGAALLGAGQISFLAGWDSAGLVYLVWIWSAIWWLDAEKTARRAVREDPGAAVSDVILLSACVISLAAVGLILVEAGNSHGTTRNVLIGLGVLSVVIAWGIVHTVYTVRYARLHYGGNRRGVDFNEREPPRYADFAYLAFTIGMTFQVSDTDLQTKEIRAMALRHALLSYVFGAIIIATAINLVAGLTK